MTELERIEAALRQLESVPLESVPHSYCPGQFVASRREASPESYSALISALRVATEVLHWYGDEESRWRKEEDVAHGGEWASRFDEEKGVSVAVPIKAGQSLGYRYVPRASLQADHGKRAIEALASIADTLEGR